MGVSLAGRGLDKSSADSDDLSLDASSAVPYGSSLADKKLCFRAQSISGNALVDKDISGSDTTARRQREFTL